MNDFETESVIGIVSALAIERVQVSKEQMIKYVQVRDSYWHSCKSLHLDEYSPKSAGLIKRLTIKRYHRMTQLFVRLSYETAYLHGVIYKLSSLLSDI